MTLREHRIGQMLFDYPLGGPSRRAERLCQFAAVAGIICFQIPALHGVGMAVLIIVLLCLLATLVLAPEREIAIEQGRLFLRTRHSLKERVWAAELAEILSLRIYGAKGHRRIDVGLRSGAFETLLLPLQPRRQRKMEEFLARSALADRLERAPPPSWMDDLRGYND